MAAVGLLSGLLRDRLQGSPMQDMTLRLCDSVQAMEGLLNSLLDLSRLEAGAVKPHLQPVDLRAMLERIQSHEQAAAQSKGLTLQVHAGPAFAHSDPCCWNRWCATWWATPCATPSKAACSWACAAAHRIG